MVKVSTICPGCNDKHVFEVTEQRYQEMKKEEKHLQDIIPDFKPENREMVVSVFCSDCWNSILPF